MSDMFICSNSFVLGIRELYLIIQTNTEKVYKTDASIGFKIEFLLLNIFVYNN
jgi:hypothetical protein